MNLTESVKSNRDIAVIVLLLIILLNILNFIPFYRIDPHSENKLQYYHGHVSSVNENRLYYWNRNIQSGIAQYDQVFWLSLPILGKWISSHYFYAIIISLAGVIVYLFIRNCGYTTFQGFISGLMYGLSAHFLEFLPIWSYGWELIFLFLPWTVYLIKRIKSKNSLLNLVLLSIILSLTFLLFEIEIIVYLIFTILIYLIYSLLDIIDNRKGIQGYLIFVFYVATALILSVLVSLKPYFYLFNALNKNVEHLINIDIWRVILVITFISGLLIIIRLDRQKLAYYLGTGMLVVFDLFVLINYLPNIRDYKQYEISQYPGNTITEHLRADSTQFRVYPLGKTFTSNIHASEFQSIGGKSNYLHSNYQRLISRDLRTEIDKNLPINWHLLSLLNVKYLISEIKIPSKRLEYSNYCYNNKKILYRIKEKSKYAWFPQKLKIMEKADIIEEINKPETDIYQMAMIEREIPGLSDEDYAVISDSVNAKASIITPHYVKIKAKSNKSGLLVISELYDEQHYWQAYVDSFRTNIHRVNYALRGVVIPEGEHTLEMYYELPKLELLNRINYWAKLMLLILLMTEVITKLWMRLEEK